MKKNFFLILALVIFTWSFSVQKSSKTTLLSYYTPYNNAAEHLFGQVKSVKERAYWAVDNNGAIVKGKVVTTKEKNELGYTLDFDAHFDRNGNIVHSKYILDDNKFNSLDIDYLDNKMLKATYTSDDTVRYYQNIEYSNEKLKVSTFDALENKLVRTTDRKLNDEGFTRYIEWSNSEGELMGYTKYKLNELNRVIGYKRYNAKDSLQSYAEYTYSNNGFGQTTKAYDDNGNIVWDAVYENLTYDDHGNWTTSIAKNDGKLTLFFEREYEYYYAIKLVVPKN